MAEALARHRADEAAGYPMLSHRFLCPASRIGELRAEWAGLAGDRPDGPLEREPLVIRHLELRANLDLHLEAHRTVVGQLDGSHVELWLRDRIEVVVLVDLLERRHQQRRLDLIGDLLLEPLDD